MELEYVKEFIVTAKNCNFSESADALFISQSTLSRHIRSLEESLGYDLFERTARKIKLNRHGEIFLEYAKQMMQVHEECLYALENEMDGDMVRVATFSSSGKYHMLDIFAKFREDNPDYQISIFEADSLYNLEKVRKGECDFAFVLEQEKETEGFEVLRLTKDELVLIVPKDHIMARQSQICARDLCGVPVMMPGKNTYVHRLCMKLFEQEKCDPNVAFTSYRSENIIKMVEKGMGIALMLRKSAQEYMTQDMVLILIDRGFEVNVSLAYRKSLEKRRINQRFLKCVKEVAEKFVVES